jgi:hypothetical protein
MTSAPRWNKRLSKHASLLTKTKNNNTRFFLFIGLIKYTKAAQCKNLVRYKNIVANTHTQQNKKPRVASGLGFTLGEYTWWGTFFATDKKK